MAGLSLQGSPLSANSDPFAPEGEEQFIEKLKARVNEQPEHRAPRRQRPSAFRRAARAVELDAEVLSGVDRSWEVSRYRTLVGYVLTRRLGYRLKDVAKCIGRDMARLGSLISRYSHRIADDEDWRSRAPRSRKTV